MDILSMIISLLIERKKIFYEVISKSGRRAAYIFIISQERNLTPVLIKKPKVPFCLHPVKWSFI